MSELRHPLLRDVEPQLTSDMERLLEEVGESTLVAQVKQLAIVDRSDDKHGTDFYMVPRPQGRWGSGHRTLSLRPGSLHVDVVGGQIVCVEVLRNPRRG